jgi:acid phosphatase
MRPRLAVALCLLLLASASASARVRAVHHPGLALDPISHVFVIVLENTDAAAAIRQPFLARLIREGASLRNYHGIAHPSQANYIAMTAGATYGVTNDNAVTLDVHHLGDLFEQNGRTWKAYVESYPGNCSLAGTRLFVRHHVPFLNFRNVQSDRARCTAHVVASTQLLADVAAGALPNYALFVPNNQNNGHDTSVVFADRYLENQFGPLLSDPRFTRGLLLVITFDESASYDRNDVLTVLWGERVRRGSTSDLYYDHYSLLRTIEDLFGTGTLGQRDDVARPIADVIDRSQ